MRISSTQRHRPRPGPSLPGPASMALNGLGALPAQTPDVPTGFAVVAPGASGTDLRGGILYTPPFDHHANRQSFPEFMETPGVKTARGLWSLVAPSVPPTLRRGVTCAWLVLDATRQFQRWNRLPPQSGPAELVSLSIDTASTALGLLSLAHETAGQSTTGLDNLGIALGYGSAALSGLDPTWLAINAQARQDSPLFKAADNVLKVVEAGLSGDPRYNGITLNPYRHLARPAPGAALLNGLNAPTFSRPLNGPIASQAHP